MSAQKKYDWNKKLFPKNKNSREENERLAQLRSARIKKQIEEDRRAKNEIREFTRRSLGADCPVYS